MSHLTKQRPGAIALITIVVISSFAIAIMTATSLTASRSLTTISTSSAGERTFAAAEAGIQDALYRIGTNGSLFSASCATPTYSTSINSVPVSVCITANGFSRTVTATADNAGANIKRTISINVTSSTFGGGFNYAVLAGGGGFELDQQATIDGTQGQGVFSNNNVIGASQTSILGNITVFGGPTNANFPIMCADPCLTNISNVTGDVHARTISNTTIAGNIWTNSAIAGAQPFDYPSGKPYPISPSDIQAFIASIPAGTPIVGSTVTGNYLVTGNKKVSGHVSLGNNESLTVDGNILFIDGDLDLHSNSNSQLFSLRLKSDSANENSLVVIVSGKITINNNNNILGSDNAKSFVLLISQKNSTTDNAIESSNNSSAAIFFAPDGIIDVKKNSIKNATAYKIHLRQQTSVVYNSNLPYFSIPPSSPQPPTAIPNTWQEL